MYNYSLKYENMKLVTSDCATKGGKQPLAYFTVWVVLTSVLKKNWSTQITSTTSAEPQSNDGYRGWVLLIVGAQNFLATNCDDRVMLFIPSVYLLPFSLYICR